MSIPAKEGPLPPEVRSDTAAQPLLVAGGPRMGTTWVVKALSQAGGVTWINEPDNEWPDAFALKAKLPLGRFPVLGPDDAAPADYELLWERALSGHLQTGPLLALARRLERKGRTSRDLWRALCDHANPRVAPWLRAFAALARPPSKRDPAPLVMVKSVHASLALEWVAARMHPRLLIVLRHPLNVIASWIDLGWGGCALDTNPRIRERVAGRWALPELPAGRSALAAVTWEVGLFSSVLEAAADEHPDWLVVSHESLCIDPVARFRELYARVGLVWTDGAARFLQDSNRPGTGYAIARVASEQPERWRDRLSRDQLDEIWSVLSRVRAPWVERVAAELA